MATVINDVRSGFYLDSVALMRVSKALTGVPGVAEAALMMATPANKRIMADAGVLAAAGEAAQGGDLVIAIRAHDPASADAALAQAAELLTRPPRAQSPAGADTWQPRTIAQATRVMPDANLALISVPGEFAVAEARTAMAAGLHAMIFSDNVPLDQERALKQDARAAGTLVMGPDCGTAIIAGVPLAFANVVTPGDIAIIGASGTGTQEIACLIDQGGGGVSHAIGVGGRDLKDAVGGITTLMAIDALDGDPATRHVVLVSKPPSDAVAATVLARIADSPKPYTVCFVGAPPVTVPANATQVFTLADAATHALGHPAALPDQRVAPPAGRAVVGLFAGGTLCAEAQAVLLASGLPVASNVPIPGAGDLAAGGASGAAGNPMIDLGDDAYTRGRPHPMIDPAVRDAHLQSALADAATGAVLIDLVLGYGAHADPAAAVVGVLQAAASATPVVASVTGTDGDPQNRAAQVAALQGAGVHVAASNAAAARAAVALAARADTS